MLARDSVALDTRTDGDVTDTGSVLSLELETPLAVVPAKTRKRRRYFRLVALAWLVVLIGLALAAPVIPLPDPTQGGFGVAAPPFGERILGTDELGRDMLSRVVFGARTSLLVGGLSVVIAMVAGVAAGLLAGYRRGKVDTAIVAIGDIVLAFPGLVFLMVVAALAGPSTRNLVAAIAFFLFPTFMRLARANTLSFSQREFVLAARGLGARDIRVAVREVLPNVLPSIRAYALAALGLVFVIEGSLSFLGLGVQPPTAAWGSMIAAGRPRLAQTPHLVLVPAIVLLLTVLSFNALSEGWGRGRLRPARLSA